MLGELEILSLYNYFVFQNRVLFCFLQHNFIVPISVSYKSVFFFYFCDQAQMGQNEVHPSVPSLCLENSSNLSLDIVK